MFFSADKEKYPIATKEMPSVPIPVINKYIFMTVNSLARSISHWAKPLIEVLSSS
jgi:hypothetical protein